MSTTILSPACVDCHANGTVHYVLGAVRCQQCANSFDEANRALAAERPAYDVAEEDCEHEFDADEGFTCLSCGKQGAEDVLSAAYDRAKDLRKYSH